VTRGFSVGVLFESANNSLAIDTFLWVLSLTNGIAIHQVLLAGASL